MSRLLEDSEKIRESLEARNLYTPDDPYSLDNAQLANTINGIIGILKPFSSIDITNTVIGRLALQPNTPIAQIGLQMLAKQFAYTVASNASAEYLPSIKFSNLFDGDPSTKFIMRKKDFQITRREGQTNFGRILDSITGVYDYSNKGNPFSSSRNDKKRINGSTVKDYIENTGKGQLEILIGNIDKNLYKSEDSGFITGINNEGLQLSLGDDRFVNRLVYPFPDSKFYPFKQYTSSQSLIGLANDNYNVTEREFLTSNNINGVKEYGNNDLFVESLGKTILKDNSSGANTYDFDSTNFGLDDSGNNQLVWGRDGASEAYKESNGDLYEKNVTSEEDSEEVLTTNKRFDNTNKLSSFNIKTGLLNYTKELLNSKGKYATFDITRKKFQDRDGQLHFNGSPLDTHPDGTTDYARRHSIADPYDRYAKAIRFNGNKMYGGNPNSVIFDSVIPKFAPSLNKENVDNRNLMFSIENLAAEAILSDDGVGYLKDELRTSIPPCEVGANGGRLMWFPPYDIRLSENAIANWTSTQFIGRGEPVYTYSNSERTATLGFKMLIDYPPQVLNYKNLGQGQFQKKISEFFAFGGESSPQYDTNLSQKEAQLRIKVEEKTTLSPITRLIEPNIVIPEERYVYFPNDYPKPASTNDPLSINPKTDIEYFINELGYEDGSPNDINYQKTIGGVDNSSNIDFIFDYMGNDTFIEEAFKTNDDTNYNSDGDPYLQINIEAGATVLFEPRTRQAEYNKLLSKRRQIATKNYLEKVIKEKLGKSAQQLKIKININDADAKGSSQSDPTFNTSDTIFEIGAIKERYAKITYSLTEATITKVTEEVGVDKQKEKELQAEIDALQNEINNIKRKMIEYSPCIFETPNKNGGYEKGFSSLLTGRFYPAFHTQTPEDFHRRLTFLHQCTRQGAAIRVPIGDGRYSSNNSVFGRQPICVLRFGDFFHTKIVIDNISFSYDETTWDTNPEGFGMQPMIADITITMKVIGGQSLATPIDALQNAVSFNYYANSTFTKNGTYLTPSLVEAEQLVRNKGTDGLTDKETENLVSLRAESINRISELYPITPTSTQ